MNVYVYVYVEFCKTSTQSGLRMCPLATGKRWPTTRSIIDAALNFIARQSRSNTFFFFFFPKPTPPLPPPLARTHAFHMVKIPRRRSNSCFKRTDLFSYVAVSELDRIRSSHKYIRRGSGALLARCFPAAPVRPTYQACWRARQAVPTPRRLHDPFRSSPVQLSKPCVLRELSV